METAPGVQNMVQVNYIGEDSQMVLPGELDLHADGKTTETRYHSTTWNQQSPTSQTNPREMQMLIMINAQFTRNRAFFHMINFTQTTWAGELPTSITPIPAMALTFWDDIFIQLGFNGMNIIPPTGQWAHIWMMRHMAEGRKNTIAQIPWGDMAGVFDFKYFGYSGGIVGTYGAAAGAILWPLVNPPPFSTTGQCPGLPPNALTPVANNATGPYYMNIPAISQGTMVQKPYQGPELASGPWLDPAMQRYRTMFKANATCQACTFIVHDAFINPLASLTTVTPPFKRLTVFQVSNIARSKIVNTRYNTYVNATNIVVTGADVAPAAATYTFNPAKCTEYFQTIQFRDDLQGNWIKIWQGSKNAITSPCYVYTILQELVQNVNMFTSNPVPNQGNVPSKIMIATRVTNYGYGLAANNTAPAADNNYVEFAYGDNHISQLQVTWTTPVNQTQTFQYLDTIANCDPEYQQTMVTRGVLNQEYWIQECGQRSLFMKDRDFGDCDSLSPADYYFQQFMPPIGTRPFGAAGGPIVVYGAMSAFTAAQPTVATNVGLHNQITTINLTAQQIEEDTVDPGVPVGVVKVVYTFNPAPPQPLQIMTLMKYQVSISYNSNMSVQSNLQIP